MTSSGTCSSAASTATSSFLWLFSAASTPCFLLTLQIYKPVSLRSLEENQADIIALDRESQGFIQSLFDLL